MESLHTRLLQLYAKLHEHFGHEPHWWPIHSETPDFEILLGAILVQQTRWETVEAAVLRLRSHDLFTPQALAMADPERLIQIIRPCAFPAQKASGLQQICRYLLRHHEGDLGHLLAGERAAVRAELLSLPRIGRETADTIMLYAGGHPIFIVDAYARRLFSRIDLLPGNDLLRISYDELQSLVEHALAVGGWQAAHLDGSFRHFLWDFHALIDELGIHHCLSKHPRCDRSGTRRTYSDARKCAAHCQPCQGCPLRADCVFYRLQPVSSAVL